ncbi:hypothetical protein Taro_038059 [Colocasia esculenta]|uniref:Retrotransposon gag domain-containing protein n=1 Tax=Colocasia esculenta TaxID=4460 RepID=A0A843WMK2_COLES|nr:hypothetical protein [Colocasia esculenta]
MTVVYGSYSFRKRRFLYDEILNISSNMFMPWIVGGDFNYVTCPTEKSGGHPPSLIAMMDFNACISASSLSDAGRLGLLSELGINDMASRGRRGVPARDGEQRRDEPRREDQGEQQAPAPQGPVLPPPPPVDYGVFMQGLVQAMQTQAHTQAALQAQLEAHERADVWWSSLLRTRFEDGAVEVGWDEFVRLFRAKFVPEHIQDKMEQEFLSLTQGSMTVLEYEARFAELSKYAPHIVADERRKVKKFVMGLKPSLRTRLVAFDHRTLEQALSAACRQEGEMEQYLEEKKATQKRPVAPFQRQERKKATF